ncbi:hypothetical protein [Listeria newyorkensis]|uniref:hypothetical protein n=1 Tax=Listeria newyorkensis TaxID=1497681 RepID=UPI00051D7104|nr:hypothetical protein [Listeria newyorkensis]KGL44096.1 hypothetical protein EP58_06510 [Listeria newyorkensis]SQC57463.1 Uncharacterised protein [Listeria newyorkensis]
MIREQRREKAKAIIEEINKLVDLHDKTKSFRSCEVKGCKLCAQIKKLGNDLNEVQNKLSPEPGEEVPALSSRTIDEYLDLEEMWTDTQISEMWAITKKALSLWKKEQGLFRAESKPLTMTIAEYLAYKQDGLSDKKIAARLGATNAQITRFKEKYNLSSKIYDYGYNGKY